MASASTSSSSGGDDTDNLLLNVDFDEMIAMIEADGKMNDEITSVCDDVSKHGGIILLFVRVGQ